MPPAARAGRSLAAGLTEEVLDRLGAAAGAVDDTIGTPGPLAGLWSVARVATALALAPVAAPVVAAAAVASTSAERQRIGAYPVAVERTLAGEPTGPLRTVHRLPADARVVVTSDLHRCMAGERDWPRVQRTDAVYHSLLDHYGAGEWHLVEDGDVEDLWMVGGSAYGVLYDLARLASPVAPLRTGVYRSHLRRIISHNKPTYDRLVEGFHRHGRYHRVIGNHDDALADPEVADVLTEVLDGLEVLDGVVLTNADGDGIGLITHGHHTDPWNAAHRATLGRLGTALGSAVSDLPLPLAPGGLAGADSTAAFLAGGQRNRLTALGNPLGANLEEYTLDEVVLRDAMVAHFGTNQPWLVLGHSHLPLVAPLGPAGDPAAPWERYLNTGSGVASGMVTAIERDPTAGGPQLVAWHHDGGEVVRTEMVPSDDHATLVPRP